MRHGLWLVSMLLTGCLFSPVAINRSAGALPTPGPDGVVRLSFVQEGASKAVFQLPLSGAPPLQSQDDSPDDGFVSQLDVRSLPPGLYVVTVFLDGAEEPAARLPFVVPPAGGGSAPTSGTQPAGNEPSAAEG